MGAVILGVPLNERFLGTVLVRFGIAPRYVSVSLKAPDSLVLKGGGHEIVHIGFEQGVVGPGKELGPISLGETFSIELVGTAYSGQSAHAHLMGNHPGSLNYRGFALQQDGKQEGAYKFAFGNGKTWLPSVKFQLPTRTRFYLTFTVERSRIQAYNWGEPVGAVDATDSLKDSDMPLTVGNWVNRDRPFHGAIDEVRITEGVLPRQDMLRNAGLFR